MGSKISVKITDHTAEVDEVVAKRMKLALSLMGEVVELHAKEDCPVDTGLLRNSITHVGAGEKISKSYHASYGSNTTKSGGRVAASSVDAGSVGYGRISGSMGDASQMEEYVGTNVEYAPYVEFDDSKHHNVGKAHFLRDGAAKHIAELKDVAEKTLGTDI